MSDSPLIPEFYGELELQELLGRVGSDVKIDRSVRIFNGKAIVLGSHIRIDSHCILIGGEGLEMGSYTHIAWGCHLTATGAPIILKGFNGLSSGVKIFSATDDYSEGFLTNPTVPPQYRKVRVGPVVLERHVIVGANSVIMPGATLEFGASVGALSYVNKTVPRLAIVSGNPLQLIGRRDGERLATLEKDLLDA